MIKKTIIICMIFIVIVTSLIPAFAKAADVPGSAGSDNLEIPESVMSIATENTYPNPSKDMSRLQPSPFTEELLAESDVAVENPELVKMLNESSIKGSKLAFGMNASIYLGDWPLSYESDETNINWDYEKVNTNMTDNRGGGDRKKIRYSQQEQKQIRGELTAEVSKPDMVKKMMLVKSAEKTNLPLSFSTMIGFGTETNREYHVPAGKMGYLHAYAPAVNENGKVTYGEVYLNIKRGRASLEVKNVTQQEAGAWIPVKDHINLKMDATSEPR